jgi:hypothetical protein
VSFNDPQTVLDEARELADQGRYEEALQRHIWFHQHALAHDRAWYGVRLSFALSNWVQLGTQYPPARQALIDIRDRTAAVARAGDWSRELFHDVTAINEYLGEPGETGALFLDLHRVDPSRAERFYRDAEAGLVARGLYAVCAAHLPDPLRRLDELRANRRGMLSAVGLPTDHAGGFRRLVEQQFAEEVGRLLVILTAVGEIDEAEQVRASALAETESADAREAIARAGH